MQKSRTLKYIAVDGPIGAGKTTLVKMLAEDMGGYAVFEPAEKNPFLPEFYKDRKRNAFKTQLYFLLNRYQQQMELKQHDLFYPLVICDYTFAKDFIFASINLSEDEIHLYNTVFQLLSAQLPQPDLVLYLRADPPVLLERIKKRGLDYENEINEDYLEMLTESYNRFFMNYDETPLLVVDSSGVDYLQNPEDFANLKRAILNHRGGTSHFIARS
ncbi:MAG: deoxynucleoside kinase [Deltaproteobacteria bacterium]|nr:deoxynucleoside kinase [Deltaproteobacteria bacterium]